jgi:hypothetical protein
MYSITFSTVGLLSKGRFEKATMLFILFILIKLGLRE